MERLDRLPGRRAMEWLRTNCRGEYALRAPELVAGLLHPQAEVAQEVRFRLEALGSPGLRAVWEAYGAPGWTAEERQRLARFLCANPDWLFERLFEEYTAHPEPGTVARRAELWTLPPLQNRLHAHVAGDGDAWLRRSSEAILGALAAR